MSIAVIVKIMTALPDLLTIGQVAHRSGLPHSALRFYEGKGLVASVRTTGNQRRYHRSVLRTLSFIKASQQVGISLVDIKDALSTLPADHAPTKADWARLSQRWHDDLSERITRLTRLRDTLTGCIGCGCLSLRSCGLYNPDDERADQGPGSKLVL
jgi:MerR family redox-sensitive transcriptional activator SoxR